MIFFFEKYPHSPTKPSRLGSIEPSGGHVATQPIGASYAGLTEGFDGGVLSWACSGRRSAIQFDSGRCSSRYGFNADEGEGSGSRNVERPMTHPPSISIMNA